MKVTAPSEYLGHVQPCARGVSPSATPHGRWIHCPHFTMEETDPGLAGFAPGPWASERWQQDRSLALSSLRQGIGKQGPSSLPTSGGPQQVAPPCGTGVSTWDGGGPGLLGLTLRKAAHSHPSHVGQPHPQQPPPVVTRAWGPRERMSTWEAGQRRRGWPHTCAVGSSRSAGLPAAVWVSLPEAPRVQRARTRGLASGIQRPRVGACLQAGPLGKPPSWAICSVGLEVWHSLLPPRGQTSGTLRPPGRGPRAGAACHP